jgi:CP family cyanate transporter-like MFS transporter
MTLGSAYVVAGVAPLGMGVLIDAAGYPAALAVIAAGVLLQGVAVLRLGPRRVVYGSEPSHGG